MNKWNVNDIIQVDPEANKTFGACFMIVAEPKPWGAKGYVLMPTPEGSTSAFLLLKFEDGVKVGHAKWIRDREAEEKN